MTEIWQDRQERGFLMFLAVFCILLPVLGILGSLWQAQGIRDALLGREARLVSGMLEILVPAALELAEKDSKDDNNTQ